MSAFIARERGLCEWRLQCKVLFFDRCDLTRVRAPSCTATTKGVENDSCKRKPQCGKRKHTVERERMKRAKSEKFDHQPMRSRLSCSNRGRGKGFVSGSASCKVVSIFCTMTLPFIRAQLGLREVSLVCVNQLSSWAWQMQKKKKENCNAEKKKKKHLVIREGSTIISKCHHSWDRGWRDFSVVRKSVPNVRKNVPVLCCAMMLGKVYPYCVVQ